jgi:hypothetical protein
VKAHRIVPVIAFASGRATPLNVPLVNSVVAVATEIEVSFLKKRRQLLDHPHSRSAFHCGFNHFRCLDHFASLAHTIRFIGPQFSPQWCPRNINAAKRSRGRTLNVLGMSHPP